MKQMEIIQPESFQVTLAARRILDLDDRETQRGIDHPGLLTAITREELEQFKKDDKVVAKRYNRFLAMLARFG